MRAQLLVGQAFLLVLSAALALFVLAALLGLRHEYLITETDSSARLSAVNAGLYAIATAAHDIVTR